jgi:hypothetical protein
MPYRAVLLTMIKIALIEPFHSHRLANRMLADVADKPTDGRAFAPRRNMTPVSGFARGVRARLFPDA